MQRIFGVIGDPISHSLSPAIHGLWIEQENIDAVYIPFHVRQSKFTTDDIAALGRCGLSGLNVTTPHKAAAFRAAMSADQMTHNVGAANTLVADDQGRWRAHNTDIEGFSSSMASWFGTTWQDIPTSVLLIGAGGAARAVAYSLDQAGHRLTIANRNLERAKELASAIAPGATLCSLSEISTIASNANIVINATSIGHGEQEFPDIGQGQGRIFFDLSYGAPALKYLGHMETQGWRVTDGLHMLIAQAAASFRIWFGIQPDQKAAFRLCQHVLATQNS